MKREGPEILFGPRYRCLNIVEVLRRIRSGVLVVGFGRDGRQISGMFCRWWIRRRLSRRLCCLGRPRDLGPLPWLWRRGAWGRGSRSLRRGGRWDRDLGGTIEWAMVAFGRELVDGRKCWLWRRTLRRGLLMVTETVWMLEVRRGKCASWMEKRMGWQAEDVRRWWMRMDSGERKQDLERSS